jgi:hypothetical protein
MRNERRTPAGTQISRVRKHVYSPMNVRKKHSYSSFRVGRPSQLQSRELLRGLLPAIFDSGSTFRSRERRRVRFVRIFARSMYNATICLRRKPIIYTPSIIHVSTYFTSEPQQQQQQQINFGCLLTKIIITLRSV